MSEIVQAVPIEELDVKSEISNEFVPHFVADLPKIDPEDAVRVVVEYKLLSDWIVERCKNTPEHLSLFQAEKGLEMCRLYKTTPNGLVEILKNREKVPTAVDLFDQFREPNPAKIAEIISQEKQRRETRDNDILAIETTLLKRRGIHVPKFTNLEEYCDWVPESTEYNEMIRRWAYEYPSWSSAVDTRREVYWDLQEHYAQIFKKAQKSFDPVSDWQAYLQGRLDLVDYHTWGLHNMGKEDISYYSMSVLWGGGARTKPNKSDYNELLLTDVTHYQRLNIYGRR